jgi:hypothetical protein
MLAVEERRVAFCIAPKETCCGDLIDVRSPKLSSTGTSTFLTIRYSYRPIAQAPHHPKEACVLVFPFQVKGIWREKRKGFPKASSFFLCIFFSAFRFRELRGVDRQ